MQEGGRHATHYATREDINDGIENYLIASCLIWPTALCLQPTYKDPLLAYGVRADDNQTVGVLMHELCSYSNTAAYHILLRGESVARVTVAETGEN